MKKDFIQIAVFIVFIVLIILGQTLFRNTNTTSDDYVTVTSDCRLDLQECSFSLPATTLTVSTQGDIQPLTPFVIKIKDPSTTLTGARVELSMLEMEMAKNEFVFEQLNTTEWQAAVVIPICTTGRRDWKVDLTFKTVDQIYLMSVLLQL